MKRLLRIFLRVVVALFVLLTVGAFAIDLSPLGASKPARSLYAGPYVQVGRTLVAYRRWGTSGTPIVLLGGAAEPAWVWHKVAPRLAAAGHRVFALDLPPFGYTQRNVQPSMSGWLSLLHGFEQRLRIVRPLLVGHSLGQESPPAKPSLGPETSEESSCSTAMRCPSTVDSRGFPTCSSIPGTTLATGC
jgi:hypothetical protein